MTVLASIAHHGAGLGYRRELSDKLPSYRQQIDVVEIMADQWRLKSSHGRLREVVTQFDTVTHGVGLSVAGAGNIDPDYLQEIRRVIEICSSEYYSEHLAATHVPGMDSQHLCPPILSAESLRTCVRNVRQAQSFLNVPLAIENITYSVSTSSDHLEAANFFADVVTEADAFVLLDVANLYINSRNHHFDPEEYLRRIPMDRVVHVHLAGGVVNSAGKLIDSHSESIGVQVWELARKVAMLCAPKTVIVERDQNFPTIEPLLKEVEVSRNIFFERENQSKAS
ncbi:DUF692 family multinuclear iron-containing protein [Streptomyces sp. NPDC050529]|uniref:DUF692 domain-containing protein n=1 Tax=Streptomyces sp. NPDC050529 TaxID=3365624 RepID=UPI00378CDDE6